MAPEKPQYLTIQFGARRRYAVPALFQREGMGGYLATDITADHHAGKFISEWIPDRFRKGPLEKLSQRKVPPNIKDRTITFPRLALDHHLRLKRAENTLSLHKEFQRFSEKISHELIKKKLPDFTHVYSMWGEGIGFLEHQKAAGKKIVVDVFVSPETYHIVCEEGKKLEGFPELYDDELVAYERENWQRVKEVADYFIVPSEFVRDTCGVEERSRILMVPTSAPPGWTDLKTKPQTGRVLFTGSVSIRKGIQYVGQAAKRLNNSKLDFRIAGEVDPMIANHEMCKNLNFLGRVLRDDMPKEYARADVFVLPSLAEGSAGAVFEALSLGLPVITTKETGTVVRDGLDGIIVPSCDGKAIAEAIDKIVNNREMRNAMSENARERAREFSWASYGKRLAHACRFFETPDF